MQKKLLLVELIHDLEQELLRLGYTDGSMNFYRRHWKKLILFAKKRDETFYSENLGIDFIEQHYHIFEKSSKHKLVSSEVQKLRVIRMIGDFQLHHAVLRRYQKHKQILSDPYFISIRNQFKSYCENKNLSKKSILNRVNQSERFMDYLVAQHITSFNSINIELIYSYIKTLSGYTRSTIKENILSIRSLLRFLLEMKKIRIDFASKIPMIKVRKQTHIPSVWTKNELKKLIAAIDRGNPKGKRDYAIILLACCLGMRCTDITCLKMENFHWEEKKLIFTQSKTKIPLSLPLTQEIGWAVIDYLKYGRPKIDSPYLFIKHIAPFGPFARGDCLYQVIKRYIELAHIPVLKKRRGMHSLRHTMASILLEKNTPLSTISDILGHTNSNSTSVYLKVDIKKLKECSLTFGGTTSRE